MKKISKILILVSIIVVIGLLCINMFAASYTDYNSGKATFYETAHLSDNWACELNPLPGEVNTAALNTTDLDNFTMSGAYVEVTAPSGKKVVVRIVDKLPSPNSGDIDLSPEAFSQLANLDIGVLNVKWKIVPGNVSGPVVYHFATGSDPWWASMQIRNHKYPVKKFEYRTSGNGNFTEVKRVNRNYFTVSNMGNGPFDFRITDIYGQQLTDTNIKMVNGGDVNGSSQFPTYSGHLGSSTPTATKTATVSPTSTTSKPTVTTVVPTQTKTASSTPSPTTTSSANEWKTYTSYSIGALVKYNDVVYKCRQAHTSLPGWEPPYVPALWSAN